jgi:hypothetical protein
MQQLAWAERQVFPPPSFKKKNNFIIIFNRHKTILEIKTAFSGLTALFQCHFLHVGI